ncbi:glycosyltransferase family 9 protein [uncultured Eudoraea sp.]|uniref:glycosyltransferase family 9 protein n=1 Tax=uncultured Eudoraea sp. TaxID=1035614 RepID=UPI00262DD9A4|nr:glycosyltransferase family 9 protein [uncultured Eudoraea sp.]
MSAVSVIVSTYSQPELLEKVLWGFNCQTFMDFELIIADQGSVAQTKELINKIKPSVFFVINHIWHENEGFPKNKILNKAILSSNSDYIIFTEGDCIPREDFVQVHYINKEPSTFISGVHYLLPLNISKTLTLKDIEEQNCFKIDWLKEQGIKKSLKNPNPSSKGFITKALNPLKPAKYNWNRQNSSGWKRDILKVNGFEEGIRYKGEDSVLEKRLHNYGIKFKQLRYSSVCIQLDHKSRFKTHEVVRENAVNMKFLVIQQKMIGDVLASTLICRTLKHLFPECTVHYVANENTLAVLNNNPDIDHIIVFKQEFSENKKALYSFLKSIRTQSYDVVIDAYGKLESNLISIFAQSQRKIAHYRWYTSWIYTDTVIESQIADNNNSLANKIRLQLLSPIASEFNDYSISPKLYLSQEEIDLAKYKVGELKRNSNQKLIMISILGSSALKTYPSEYMSKVVDVICSKTDGIVLFNYLPNQRDEARAIYDQCNEVSKSLINFDFYANSLREFILILSQCDALIGNEGGAANMAKALRVPTFCLFSPFIVKEAWHDSSSELNIAIHLNDYHPELFVNMNKKKIKKVIRSLYAYFKPILFEDELLLFLNKYCNSAIIDNSLNEKY